MLMSDETMDKHLLLPLARTFYETYCLDADGKNFRGDPCPEWTDLPENIQRHWLAVAKHAQRHFARRFL